MRALFKERDRGGDNNKENTVLLMLGYRSIIDGVAQSRAGLASAYGGHMLYIYIYIYIYI